MNRIAEIDRAVLELPEDLQIIWMRFRPLVIVGFEPERPSNFLGVRLWVPVGTYIRADIYHPHTNSLQGWSTVSTHGTPLHVARNITEFFRDRTQQRCTTEVEAV